MNRFVPLFLLIAGAMLLAFGISAAESMGSEISEIINGAPTDKSIWLILAGIAGILLGGIALLRRA